VTGTEPEPWTPKRVGLMDTKQFYFVSSSEGGIFRADATQTGAWTIRKVLYSRSRDRNAEETVVLGAPVVYEVDVWTFCSRLTAMGAIRTDSVGVPV